MPMDPAFEADALQEPWLLPFELVDLDPERPAPRFGVVADDGTLFDGSGAPGPAEREVALATQALGPRRAWVIAARVEGREHVLATDPFAREAAAAWLAERDGERVCWLLRATDGARGIELLPLRGPEPVLPRPLENGPVDLLCDLGMVLCAFDRGIFPRAFAATFDRVLDPAVMAGGTELRLRFEAGTLDEDAFAAALLPRLGLAAPDRAALERLWAMIFTPKRSTLALLRALRRRPGVELVVVSNTDPWSLRACRERLGLEDLLEGAVASFQPGVRPKGTDASMWRRAREVAAARRGAPARRAIAIDDVRPYLAQALASGAATDAVHYRGYASLRRELGRLGLFWPARRDAAPADR